MNIRPTMGDLYSVGIIQDEDLNRTEPCRFPEIKDVPQQRIESLHNQLVASAKVITALRLW